MRSLQVPVIQPTQLRQLLLNARPGVDERWPPRRSAFVEAEGPDPLIHLDLDFRLHPVHLARMFVLIRQHRFKTNLFHIDLRRLLGFLSAIRSFRPDLWLHR